MKYINICEETKITKSKENGIKLVLFLLLCKNAALEKRKGEKIKKLKV